MKKEYNYMLISYVKSYINSDGGSIDTAKFKTFKEAQEQMVEEYNSYFDPDHEYSLKYSYIEENMAYVCGNDTGDDEDRFWSIVEI